MLLHPFDTELPDHCEPGHSDCPAGEKCSPYAPDGGCCVGAAQCVPLLGSRAEGEACTREAHNDDCGADLFCMAVTSGAIGEGICLRLCAVEDPNCVEGTCRAFNDGFLPICVVECDPLAQDCLGPDFGCYALPAEGDFVCAPTGIAGQDDDACETFQSCAPGVLCLEGSRQTGCDADYCCTPVCDPNGDGSECVAAGEGCEVLFPDTQGAACVLPE